MIPIGSIWKSRVEACVVFKSVSKIVVVSIWFQDFPGGTIVKNLPAKQKMQETQDQSPGQEDPLG